MQFETAEGVATGSLACSLCSTTLGSAYHELNGQATCASCRGKADAEYALNRGLSRFLLAAAYGIGASILGGILYWGFVKVTDIELGLMAIAVGWLVGKAVMKGSNQRGGRRYQVLATALTYVSISMSYGALFVGEVFKNPASDSVSVLADSTKQDAKREAPPSPAVAAATDSSGPVTDATPAAGIVPGQPTSKQSELTPMSALVGVGFLFLFMLASPFLSGFSNIIGWLIIAIGLWEAWRHTQEVPYVSGGPYTLAPPPPTPTDDSTAEGPEPGPASA